MSLPFTVTSGLAVLNQLLREQNFDLRTLDPDGFRRWLERQLSRWQTDPVFTTQVSIRDLRRVNPRLRDLEKAQRQTSAAEAVSLPSARLRQLEQELLATDQAIAGLDAALGQAAADRAATLRDKLATFQVRQRALQAEQAELQQASAPWQALQAANAELQQLRSRLGLEDVETHLKELQRQRGRSSSRAGGSFEEAALTLIHSHVLPHLLRHETAVTAGRLRVLQGVTLGAARLEFDQVVVRQWDGDASVEVLALIEVKRNLNDLGHGFRLRQENLAWLIGSTDNYDPELYRTAHFRSGHFDRPAVHEERDEQFLFEPGSFGLFRLDAVGGQLISRLYFITQPGPLWGVSTANLGRIAHRVSTDETWSPNSDAYLNSLFAWCRSLAGPLEASDVLRLYAETPDRAGQILFVELPR